MGHPPRARLSAARALGPALGVTVSSLHPNCIPGRTRAPGTQSGAPRTQQGLATPVTIPSAWRVVQRLSPVFRCGAPGGTAQLSLMDTPRVSFRDPREDAWGGGPGPRRPSWAAEIGTCSPPRRQNYGRFAHAHITPMLVFRRNTLKGQTKQVLNDPSTVACLSLFYYYYFFKK